MSATVSEYGVRLTEGKVVGPVNAGRFVTHFCQNASLSVTCEYLHTALHSHT